MVLPGTDNASGRRHEDSRALGPRMQLRDKVCREKRCIVLRQGRAGQDRRIRTALTRGDFSKRSSNLYHTCEISIQTTDVEPNPAIPLAFNVYP